MSFLSLTQSFLGESIPVLCYHQVRPGSGMSPEKFGRQLDMIAQLGLKSIRLDHLLGIISGKERPSGPSIVITFDDCTLDNWVYAVPELLRRGMQGVFFAITDFLASGPIRPRSDQGGQVKTIPPMGDIMRQAIKGRTEWFMNIEELRALVRETGMEVYSHSAAHQACFKNRDLVGILSENKHWSHGALCGPGSAPDTPVYPVGSAYAHNGFGRTWNDQPLTLCTHQDRQAFCLEDFTRSKATLENALDRPCPFLCLPWGEYDEITQTAARLAGFEGLLTLDHSRVGAGIDPMRIGRRAVKDDRSVFELAIRLFRDAVGKC